MLQKVKKCIIVIILGILLADLIYWLSTGKSIIAEQLLVHLLVGVIVCIYAIAESMWYIAAMILISLLSSVPAYLLQKNLPADVKYLAKIWPLFCFMLAMAALQTWTFWAAAFYVCVLPAILGIAAVEVSKWSDKKSEESWGKLNANE